MSKFPFQDGIQQWMKQSSHATHIEKFVQESISKSLANPMDMFQKNVDTFNNMFEESRSNMSESETSNASEPNMSNNQTTTISKVTPTIFDSLDDVYVKIPIHDPASLKNLKISYTKNQVILEGFPQKEQRQVLLLPALVKKKGANTSYKDGILQIKLPKALDLQYTEIDVPPID